MTTNDYQQHQDLIYELALQIDELTKDKAALTAQLNAADIEIANLRRKLTRLKGGQLELFGQALNASDANRIDWQFHHQSYRRKTDCRVPKYH